MRPTDGPRLTAALASLAEVFGSRPLSERAVAVWVDTLREFSVDRVLALLGEWPRTHAKMPVPKDVWAILNDERTDRLERDAAAMKDREKREVARLLSPAVGNAALKRIREMLAPLKGRGHPTGPELARLMLDDAANGKRLSIVQRQFVAHNLGWTMEQIDEIELAARRDQEQPEAEPWPT